MNDNVIKLRKSNDDFPLAFTAIADIDLESRKHWLVKDFLGTTEMSCKFGIPGSAKSVLAGDLGAHVATGKPWFGRPVLTGSVLYIACERPALVQRRFAAWKRYHGVENAPLAVIQESVDLCTNSVGAENVIRFADRWAKKTGHDPRLIQVDTVSRALFGGDENSPRDMGRLVSHLQLIQDRTGAHVQAIHHVPTGMTTRMRGHGCLLGACDTTVSLEKYDASIRTATTDKNNDGPTGERLAFFLRAIELGRDPQTGQVTTAPVVIPAEGNIPEKKRRRQGDGWSKALAVFREAIASALKTNGHDYQPPESPAVKAVALDYLRDEHRRLYVNTGDGDPQAAERKAWSRAFKSARGNNLVSAETAKDGAEMIWLTPDVTSRD
jgi:hypothetical protein